MDLVVDIFIKKLQSISNGPTQEQFDMFVQQQFEIYEKEMLNPEFVAGELLSTVTYSNYYPPWEKHKRLRSISFLDFQQFCRIFCEQVRVTVQMHGNIEEDHALVIMQNLLNNFQCKRIEIVSMSLKLLSQYNIFWVISCCAPWVFSTDHARA